MPVIAAQPPIAGRIDRRDTSAAAGRCISSIGAMGDTSAAADLSPMIPQKQHQPCMQRQRVSVDRLQFGFSEPVGATLTEHGNGYGREVMCSSSEHMLRGQVSSDQIMGVFVACRGRRLEAQGQVGSGQ